MAKVIRVITTTNLTCDFCVPLFQEPEARIVTEDGTEQVKLPSGVLLEGEICTVCRDKILDPWYKAFEMLGREAETLSADEAARELVSSVVGQSVEPRAETPPERPVEAPVAPEPAPLVPESQIRAKAGEAPTGAQKMPKGEVCIWPGCDYTTPSVVAFPQHVRTKHQGGMKMFGSTCPLCNTEWDALGTHTKKTHNLSVARAFSVAEYREGDPHGVVERVRQSLAAPVG